MKVLVAMLALATLLTSPAVAQYAGWQGPYRGSIYASRAFAPRAAPYARYYNYQAFARSTSRFAVYDTRGWYVGSDPDPRVRFMLLQDAGWNSN